MWGLGEGGWHRPYLQKDLRTDTSNSPSQEQLVVLSMEPIQQLQQLLQLLLLLPITTLALSLSTTWQHRYPAKICSHGQWVAKRTLTQSSSCDLFSRRLQTGQDTWHMAHGERNSTRVVVFVQLRAEG
jgi:hypothetical protein